MSAAPKLSAAPALVRLESIAKSYALGAARVQALRGVSLQIAARELVALTGPSGSGKSTLLHVLGLIDAPDAGRYLLDDRELAGLPERELALARRELIGFVFQSFNLVPVLSAFENVEYPLLLDGTPARERRERVLQMIERVGLGGLATRWPDELSGGQRQRVAIARALVKRPRLVLADEPTANLDGATAAQVIELLRELAREEGATIVVATHDPRLTAHCDRSLALVDGALQ